MRAKKSETFRSDYLPSILLGVFLLATAPTMFFLPVFFKEDLHFSATEIGVIFALQAVTGILAAFPTGVGNDRITSRTWISASLIVMLGCFLLMANTKSFAPFLAVFFFWALAYNIFRLSMDIQLLKTDTGERTGQRISNYQGVKFLGLLIGTVGAGYVIERVEFRITFIIIAAICAAVAAVSLLLPATPIKKAPVVNYKADFLTPKVLFFAGWLFVFTLHWGVEYTCYGLFVRDSLGLSFIDMGWFMSGEYTAILVTVLATGGGINKPQNIKRYAVYGLLFSGIGHIGMVFEPVWLSFSFRTLHGVGDGFIFMVFYMGIAKLFSIEHLGGNTGLINLVTMTATIVGALISSPIGAAFGYGLPIFVTGVLMLLLIIPLAIPRFAKYFSMN